MSYSRETLRQVHELRMKAHWGKRCDLSQFPWPNTDAEWRQTSHGAPWDTNVQMAEWHLDFAHALQREGLITGNS